MARLKMKMKLKCNNLEKGSKTIFVNRKVLEIAVCSAVIEFNDGYCGIVAALNAIALVNGFFTNKFVLEADKQQVQAMEGKSSKKAKYRRKKLRSSRKGFLGKEKENEKSESYLSGAF